MTTKKKKTYDPSIKLVPVTAWCPKCNTECWYEPGKQHHQFCDGILKDIKEKTSR